MNMTSFIQQASSGNYEELTQVISTLTIEEINARGSFGWTALRQAAVGGYTSCVQLLLRYGAEFDNPDVKGQTPLFSVVNAGHTDIVQLLLDHGANPNGSPQNMSCPLMNAIIQGSHDIVQLLLEYGADADCSQSKQVNLTPSAPVNTALQYQHFDILRTILLYGATVNYSGVFSPLPLSPMHLIAKKRLPLKYTLMLYEFGCQLDENCNEILKENEELKNEIIKIFRYPRTLMSTCRLLIFKTSPTPPMEYVSRLDIPEALQQYLTFNEFT